MVSAYRGEYAVQTHGLAIESLCGARKVGVIWV